MLAKLGPDGMSSDETDTESNGAQPKTLRRITKPWHSRHVSALLRYLDKTPIPRGQKLKGNSYLVRHPEPRLGVDPHPGSHTVTPVAKLPENYYDDAFYRALKPREKQRLQRGPIAPLPVVTA